MKKIKKYNPACPLICVLVPILVLSMISCDHSPEERREWFYSVPEETGDGWQTASVESVNIQLETLQTMMQYIIRNDVYHNIHAILLLRNHHLVFEEYFPGFDYAFDPDNNNRGEFLIFNRDTPHCMHSTTKTFTSALIGIAIDKGFIDSDQDPVFDYLDDYDHLKNTENENILLEHLLSNTAGLSWNENYVFLGSAENDLLLMGRSPDPIGFILGKPMVAEPGTLFNYSGGNTNVLGEVIKRAGGLNASDFSRRYLFEPLGIYNFRWLFLQNGVVYTSGDLYITPRSMAKFGQLFLNRGIWNGRRIISEEWVERSTAFYTEPSSPEEYLIWSNGYGYCWWLNDFTVNGTPVHTYFTSGWGGQAIYVIPRLDTVVVFTAGNYWNTPGMEKVQSLLTSYILPAIH